MMPKKGYKQSPEHLAKRRAALRGWRKANPKGWSQRGYHDFSDGTHEIGAHRVLAEQVIGRALSPDEVVHHRDGDATNNDPGNLEVMSRSAHCGLHNHLRAKSGLSIV